MTRNHFPHSTSFKFIDLYRFPVSPLPLDSSPHLVSQEIVEIKTLLVKVKSLLEKESSEDLTKIRENDSERQNLETQIKQLKEELRLKNNKISELEKLINTKKETISTQVLLFFTKTRSSMKLETWGHHVLMTLRN